jgi:hypothetical protein
VLIFRTHFFFFFEGPAGILSQRRFLLVTSSDEPVPPSDEYSYQSFSSTSSSLVYVHRMRLHLRSLVQNTLPVACRIWLPVAYPSPPMVPRQWQAQSRLPVACLTSTPGTCCVRPLHASNTIVAMCGLTRQRVPLAARPLPVFG